jgi:hypothetical protein
MKRAERGAALIWTALAMTTLLGAAAFAVDLGWIYLNATRLQAAADAAALAGVVNLPGFPSEAEADAVLAAANNGFAVTGPTTLTDNILAENRYQVTLESEIPTFFLTIFGMDSMTVGRDAVAEYVKPVKLGSPENQFGGPGQDFWAAINGQYTDREQGDPYSTRCIENDTGEPTPRCTSENPWYRAGGYYYAVEVETGATGLQVSLYDPGHYVQPSGSSAAGTSDPGDTSWVWNDWGGQTGIAVSARLYAPDSTPSDPTDNSTQVCSAAWGTYTGNPPSSASRTSGGFNTWKNVCSSAISNPIPGIYVLQLPAPLYEGSSKFALRATTSSGAAPKLYGLLDMSIHVNQGAGAPRPWLAEVRPEHAGKTLQVDIFDIGESNTMTLEIWDNNGTVAGCSWTATNGESQSSVSSCVIDVGGRRLDSQWLNLSIPIPDDYTCDVNSTYDCWWRVNITGMSSPTDRTTWTGKITGDPVRLIE